MNAGEAVPASADESFMREFASRWVEAWNSREPERLLALMTEDIVYDHSMWPRTMRGHSQVREFLEFAWRSSSDMRIELAEEPFPHPNSPKACLAWRCIGTQTGPINPPGLAPTGRWAEVEGVDFHEYRDGRLSRVRAVVDMADFMRQIGVLPTRGGKGERAMATAQRLQAKLRRRKSR